MDLVKARQNLMDSDDIKQLYNIELDLTEYVAQLHKNIITAGTIMEQSEEKGTLTMANALIGICRERQAEVKNTGGKFNYNFRMAAFDLLHETVYKEIAALALLPRKSIKKNTKN